MRTCDPDPANSIYQFVYDLAAELQEKAAARVELLKRAAAKMPKVPDPRNHPLRNPLVQKALAYAHEQGRHQGYNEAMRSEALSAQRDRSNQERLFGHTSRTQVALRQEDERDICDTPTENNPIVKPEPYAKDEMEPLDEFFNRCVEDFREKRNRYPSLARMGPLNASMLPILIKTDIQIYIDHDIGEERMTLW